MASAYNTGANFWGVLINPDKSAAPLLEQLCLGIAQVMFSFDDYATTDLTPDRLAAFYRKVGGNYDVLFLETKPSALSFIYQRLGCFHSIQPSNDPYKPPSIPALQPNGFVRWQTIQLLMEPDEHYRYLQRAVELWDIKYTRGGLFPKTIPRDAFPSEPDPEMVEWHEGVTRRFEFDYLQKNILRSSPPNFGPYHNHFNQTAAPSNKADRPHGRRAATPPPRRHAESNDLPRRSRHRRNRSTEGPQSTARKVDSTFFSRHEDGPTFTSSRAPSPVRATESTKARSRERPKSFAHPVNLETEFIYTSDASLEDSETPIRDPRARQHSQHRSLSPRSAHARRHSHEAYARKPKREISPDSRRQNTYRDTQNPNPGRPYDSDSARKSRRSKVYNEGPIPSRSSGIRFYEHAYHDLPIISSPEVPLYPHIPAQYVSGLSTNYMAHPHPMDDPRRGSYRDDMANLHSSGGRGARSSRTPGWTTPVHSSNKRGIPINMADLEYHLSTGRRATMYDL